VADGVDLRKIAAMTPGFVGADLANLVNEAALLAARRGKDAVGAEEFHDSIERVVAGLERRSRVMNPEEKRIVAYHEAGHALVACLLPGVDPVRKVSMIARGAALGYTMQMPLEDRYLLRKSEMMDRLAVVLGGRAAEEVVFNEISTGPQNDLVKASDIARSMVLEFGMSDELGPLAFPHHGMEMDPMGISARPWSERTNREIDRAIKDLVWQAYGRARDLITAHRDAMEALAKALMENEVVEQEELRELLKPFGIEIRDAIEQPGGASAQANHQQDAKPPAEKS
jgi:cell division protease FtsH